MDALFRRLHEVADLPNSVSASSSAHEAGTSEETAMDAEELIEAVREARRLSDAYKCKWEALRTESAQLNDEYAAYKAKVQGWREQVRIARAQDRKTIELLRNSSQNGGSTRGEEGRGGEMDAAAPSHGGGPVGGNSTEAVYVSSLEEQVRQLKEVIRQGNEDRSGLRVEVKKLQEQHREALIRLSDLSTPSNVSSDAATNDSKQSVAALVQLRLDAKDLELQQLQRTIKDLELQNEVLAEEGRLSADAVHRLESAHHEQLSKTQGLLDEHRQVQYIRSLESEVRMWKAEAQAARVGLTPMDSSPSNHDASNGADDGEGGSSTSFADRRVRSESAEQQQLVQLLRAQVAEKDDVLREIRVQMADLSMEASLREESIERMFSDCREFEQRLSMKQDELLEARKEAESWQLRCEMSERECREIKRESEDLFDRLSLTQGQLAKLSKEHAQVGEALRGLRLQLAMQGNGGAPKAAAAAGSLSADVTPSPDASQPNSDNTFAYNLVSEVANLLSSRTHQLRNVRAAQEQVHHFWTELVAKRRAMWSTTRWRLHLLIVLFLLLVILFSFYQAIGAMDETSVEETLRRCESDLKALRKS